jgi:hypothetical protein
MDLRITGMKIVVDGDRLCRLPKCLHRLLRELCGLLEKILTPLRKESWI